MPSLRRLHAPRSHLPRTIETPLYRAARRDLDAFLTDAAAKDHCLPDFIVQTLADFRARGDPAR